MLGKLLLVLVGLVALASNAQAQLVNVQIGRRFAPVRRPWVQERVIDSYGREIVPAPPVYFQGASAWAQPAGHAQLAFPRIIIEVRIIRPAEDPGVAFQAPPWSASQAFQAPPWSAPQLQQPPPWSASQPFQAPPWSAPQLQQPPLVCGPGG